MRFITACFCVRHLPLPRTVRGLPGWIVYAGWAAGAVSLLVAAAVWLPSDGFADMAHRVRDWGFLGMLLFGALFVLTALLLLPGAPLIFLGGVVYGQWLGFLVVSVAATVAAGIVFCLAGTVAGRWLERRAQKHRLVGALVSSAHAHGFSLVLLARLSPLVPFSALNLVMGAAGLRLRTFLLASWLGKSPSIFAIIYAAQATDLGTAGHDSPSLISHALFVVGLAATAYGTWRVVSAARQVPPRPERPPDQSG